MSKDGIVDTSVPPSGGKTLVDFIQPGQLAHETQAAQYDNPRGYPGLAGLQMNRPKGSRIIEHDTQHKMEQEGQLARTGSPEFSANHKTRDGKRKAVRTARSVAEVGQSYEED